MLLYLPNCFNFKVSILVGALKTLANWFYVKNSSINLAFTTSDLIRSNIAFIKYTR